ncbi:hypothetical protein G9A89_013292 [Geosiphon pyriformis]|nr:hypothetical protein G9A89_013292 [Geosiphon pyriformis]
MWLRSSTETNVYSTTKSRESSNILTDDISQLTPDKETQFLNKFRELLGEDNILYDDQALLRYLVAKNFQLESAKQQLLETTKWRLEKQIDSIPLPVLNPGTPIPYPVRGLEPFLPDANVEGVEGVPDFILLIYNYFGGHALHKTDKYGQALFIERLGYHDLKNFAKFIKLEDLISWHLKCQETTNRVIMPELSARTGKIIDKHIAIFDCEGMGFHYLNMAAMNMFRELIDLDQMHYPERLGKLFIVNAPFIFVSIWAIAKRWLEPRTLEKVHIFGKDYKKTLLEHIPEENLPSFLGGACTCSHIPELRNQTVKILATFEFRKRRLQYFCLCKGNHKYYENFVINHRQKENVSFRVKFRKGNEERKIRLENLSMGLWKFEFFGIK